jgi:NADH-quinone oxidoreductase subunit C
MPAPDAIASLQKQFPGKVGKGKEFREEWTLEVDREVIRAAATYLKQELGFNMLFDVSSVDNFGDEPRYDVLYEFGVVGRLGNNNHLRVKVRVSEDDLALDSLVPVYQGADWHEREIFDMMGIRFNGHPDLRRILMWEGYPYFPLRKDFPLEGKSSNMPGEAFSRPAPMEGGPFVAPPIVHPPAQGDAKTTLHEPRAKPADRGNFKWD